MDALPPNQFCESVKNEFIIDDTAKEKPETLSQRVFRLATKWPEIQRVVDAAAVDENGRNRE